MSEIAALFAEMMLSSYHASADREHLARQWREAQESQRLNLRQALYTEIGFIEQTPEHINKLEDMEEPEDIISEVNEEISDILDHQEGISREELTDEVFKDIHYNIRLFSIAQSAQGRLPTTVYEGNIAQIGVLTVDEITVVVNFYSVVISLRGALNAFAESIQTGGILPASYLSPVEAIKREMAIANVENLAEVAADLEPQERLLQGMTN